MPLADLSEAPRSTTAPVPGQVVIGNYPNREFNIYYVYICLLVLIYAYIDIYPSM